MLPEAGPARKPDIREAEGKSGRHHNGHEHRSAPNLSSRNETKSHNRLKYVPTMHRQKTGISMISVDKQFSAVDRKAYQLHFQSTVF